MRVTGRVRLADGREGRIVSTQLEHYTDRGARKTKTWLVVELDDGSKVPKLPHQITRLEP